MEKRMVFRLAMVVLLLYSFYLMGLPIEALAVLGALFVVLILLRGKIWKKSEHLMEKYLPFTKNWSAWKQKVLIIIIFFLIYMVLKYVLYFILGLAGIDMEEILMQAMDLNSGLSS